MPQAPSSPAKAPENIDPTPETEGGKTERIIEKEVADTQAGRAAAAQAKPSPADPKPVNDTPIIS